MRSLPAPVGAAMKMAATMLSPAGGRAALLVLIYHRVLPEADPLLPSEPDAQRFAAHMDVLGSLFNVLPLVDAVRRLRAGSLPSRAACVTFDDGYANNLDVAAPILRARNMPATVFVSTGFTGGGRMWNDTIIETVRAAGAELDLTPLGLGRYELKDMDARRSAVDRIIDQLKYLEPVARLARVDEVAARAGASLPNELMMTEQQLRELSGLGIDIGAHTINHPILTRIEDERARSEILGGKRRLEEIIGRKVESFAYPNGRPTRDYESRHVGIVRDCGFSAAVSTAWGAARRESDPLQVPRVAPWDQSAPRFAARLLKAYLDPRATTV